jgi:rhodanese-related sulfurtransferase
LIQKKGDLEMRVDIAICVFCIALCNTYTAYSATQDEVSRIKVEELKKMMDEGKAVTIIDTQPRDVYEMEHIKGAISLPWKREISQQDVRGLPKNKLLVTYCDCGPGESDSADVASQLLRLGFENVKVLQDPSIQQWRKAGYPMEKK